MKLKVPFFGMLSDRSPMRGLLEHYEQIEIGLGLVRESMECYITGGPCKDFNALQAEVDAVEDKADKIKRNIRNHLPRGLFMAVDKTLFINYTRSQDNILDSGQDALAWLGTRRVNIDEDYQLSFVDYLEEVAKTVENLKPALTATVELIEGNAQHSRESIKQFYRAVRYQHKTVSKARRKLASAIYNSPGEFKDIYLLLNFVDSLHNMSHNAENCADMLRAMIVR